MSRRLLKLFLVVIIIFISGCEGHLFNSEGNACSKSGGEWKTMSDSCVDKCDTQLCAEVLTSGCDCGSDKCWNGNDCVLNKK